jgi:DNA polymerase I-like protein with 3'-5' exonuclease and polymerase domains
VLWPAYEIPNFHPAYILREWSDRDVAVFVFRRLKEEYDYWKLNGKHQPLPERQLIAEPSFAEAREYLEECLAHDGPISEDIELLARRVPICDALSYSRNSAISVEFFGYPPREQSILLRLIDRINKTKTIIGQNWTTFDANWIEAMGINSGIARVSDCLVRHHVLHVELSHKLDFQVMQYSRQPYYKDEGKGWNLREGMTKLKRYNCLDACCTLEVHEEQDKEFEERPDLRRFYDEYAMPLARRFFYIGKRGTMTDPVALASLRSDVVRELDEKCVSISKNLGGRPVARSEEMARALSKQLNIDVKNFLNISSVPQLKNILVNDLRIKLKVDRKTHKESTGEESLNEAFASTGNPVLKDILRTRELNKVLGTNIDIRREGGVFYSCESVTGTVTGRRASRKNFLGFGSNGQNQTTHSDLGERLQGVFIARPNHIFVYCDQASAEEWIVQGIIADVSKDDRGIIELKKSMETGISRHAILASQLFGLPISQVNNKECLEYFIGKKTRHACNYDMRENTMAAQMAAAGFPVKIEFCRDIQTRFHQVEPNIRGVYHKYIQETLCKEKKLTTPLGRERVFHGLRPYGDNAKIFREGYAQIPQSTVGDNNGMAILFMEQHSPVVLRDGHDSMLCETFDNFSALLDCVQLMRKAYDRVLRFPHGFEVRIPVDFKIGYSIKGLKKCPDPSNEVGLRSIYEILSQQRSPQQSFTSGQLLPSLVQP